MRDLSWYKPFVAEQPLEWSPEPQCCCQDPKTIIDAGCKLHGIYPAQRAAEAVSSMRKAA